MNKYDMSDKKKAIIATTWEYLLKKGLTNASIGELCKDAKLAQSSLYYWFANKDDIWISAGKYGLTMVVDKLMEFTLNHIDKVDLYFHSLLDEVEKYKLELRLALQITTSPVFGERMRDKSKDFNQWYEFYTEKLVEAFNCTYLQAQIFIYTIISLVVDFAIWDDRAKTQMLLDNLYERVLNNYGKNN